MKNYLFSLVLLFSINAAFAAPTVEGLFRNGNNSDLNADLVVATFSVEELPTEISKETLSTRYVKIFMMRSSSKVEVLQTDFPDNRFFDPTVLRSNYRGQLLEDVRSVKNFERSIFFSTLGSLLLNDSKTMNNFLKAHTTAYKTNRELMNSSKVELLQKYKDYLIAVSEEGGSIKDAIKASKQGDAEERAKAMEVISQGIYDKTDKVHLTQEGGQFYWAVDLGQVKALFTNEEHRLKKMQMSFENSKSIELECGEYVRMDGTHELPRTISFRDSSNSLYRITFLTLAHVSDKGAQATRAAKYENLVKANKNKNVSSKFTHSFLY